MHDMVDLWYIKTSGSDIRREQHRLVGALEPIERLQTRLLLHARMEHHHRAEVEQRQERVQSPNTIDASQKHDALARIAQEEVVELQVLVRRQTVEAALVQRRHFAALGQKVDHFRLGVSEVEGGHERAEGAHLAFVLGLDGLALGRGLLEVLLELFAHGGREDVGAHVGAGFDGLGRVNVVFKVVDEALWL